MIISFDNLKAYQDSLQKYGIGGNDLAVYVDFKPVYRYMTGWQNMEDGRKIAKDTMYKMFSMTKPVTVTAAMQATKDENRPRIQKAIRNLVYAALEYEGILK